MELIVRVKFMEGRNIMGYRSQRRFHGKGRLERRAVIIWEKRKLSGKCHTYKCGTLKSGRPGLKSWLCPLLAVWL